MFDVFDVFVAISIVIFFFKSPPLRLLDQLKRNLVSWGNLYRTDVGIFNLSKKKTKNEKQKKTQLLLLKIKHKGQKVVFRI